MIRIQAAQFELVRSLSVAVPLGISLSIMYLLCTDLGAASRISRFKVNPGPYVQDTRLKMIKPWKR